MRQMKHRFIGVITVIHIVLIEYLEAVQSFGIAIVCYNNWHATSEELTALLLLLIILQRIIYSHVGILWVLKPRWISLLAF